MRMKKLYTHHSIYLLFAVCWLSYFSTYLGRLNFTACIAAINEAENLSKLELGRVSSAFFVCYGGAQLFSGLLADRPAPQAPGGRGAAGRRGGQPGYGAERHSRADGRFVGRQRPAAVVGVDAHDQGRGRPDAGRAVRPAPASTCPPPPPPARWART